MKWPILVIVAITIGLTACSSVRVLSEKSEGEYLGDTELNVVTETHPVTGSVQQSQMRPKKNLGYYLKLYEDKAIFTWGFAKITEARERNNPNVYTFVRTRMDGSGRTFRDYENRELAEDPVLTLRLDEEGFAHVSLNWHRSDSWTRRRYIKFKKIESP